MPLPRESRPDDEELRRYLLELLTDEDRERLDHAAIVDDEVAVRLRMAEEDLVHDYVRGTLEGATLARFQSHYLLSPLRREHVRFASRFVRAVGRAGALQAERKRGSGAGAGEVSGVTGWRRPAGTRWMPSRPMLASSLAAVAALLLVANVTLLFEGGRLSRRPDVGDTLAVHEPVTASASGSAPAPADAETAAGTETAAQVLLPLTRSIDPIPALRVPRGGSRAVLELRLESNDFPRYQVGLKDPATNRIVWRSDWIAPHASGARASVSIAIPARLLKPQHYSLDLVGRTATGRTDSIESYTFQIVP